MTFGENIKRIRKEKGMSQQALGEKLGVKQQTIAQYEKIQEMPKLETVRRIAAALGVYISDLEPDWSQIPLGEIKDDFKHGLPLDELEILQDYQILNDIGKTEARKRVNELTEIPKYQKDKEE